MKQFNVNVAPLLKKLELVSKKGISGFLSGEYRSVFKGRGLEFNGYRNYNAQEDDAKDIDWKASMRSRYLVVKELVEERNNNIVFMIDVSSSMSFGSTEKLKNEYVIEMFASMAHSLLVGGDSVGLVMFADRMKVSIPSNIGNKQFYMMLKNLTTPELYEGEYDLETVIREFNASMPRKAIVILITDFIGLKGNWEEQMKLLCAKHEVIVFIVNDPRDLTLPAETGPVFTQSPFGKETLLIDTKLIKDKYEKAAKEHNAKMEEFLKRQHTDYLFITTDQPFAHRLFMFFKARQMG